ncbi:MAG: hypothetical protein JNM40_21530 [Myxococcales bacterium]|jgi:hypothetical protein|nr:hypothetical protein [Myxococcales bacterium]
MKAYNNNQQLTLSRAAVLAMLLSGSCGNEPAVKISLSEWPAGASIVRLEAMVNGVKSAVLPPLENQQTQFVIKVPSGSTGTISLIATAFDGASESSCKVAKGTIDIDIPSGLRSYEERSWLLQKLASKLCTLSVSVQGAVGSVTSVPAGISCGPSNGGTCQAEFKSDESVSLIANVDLRWRPSWQGSCFLAGEQCQIKSIANSQRIDVSFSQRQCTTSNWCSFSSSNLTTNHLQGVWASSPMDAWAVGQAGTILHWDGVTWSVVSASIPKSVSFFSVWGSGANDVWAMGPKDQAWHWDGTSWKSVNLPSSSFADLLIMNITGSASDDIWAVGSSTTAPTTSGTVYHWDGSVWSIVSGLPFQSFLYSIWQNKNTKDVWTAGLNQVVYYYSNATKTWASRNTGIASANVISLNGNSATDVWNSGASGSAGMVYRWDGTKWISISISSYAPSVVSGIVAPANNDAWAITDSGQIFHFTGSVASTATLLDTLPNKPPLAGIWANSSTDLWVVGQNGAIFRRIP